MPCVELWGGPECTLNRVGDMYRDQFVESGHSARLSDLDLFAELGIAALRYPILWEQVSPDDPEQRDWDWSDARLNRLRALAIRPIVGLVHHGSGPRYTDLLADSFAPGLAAHARALAERHPWLEDWTPVNEPVTTARFAALYGLWCPHHRSERSFWLALLNQIDAVRLSMAEVRRINPAARLIQTDDLGRTYATAAVRDQAAFDNVRRWMSWDLLCGRVVPGHALWSRLCGYGFEDRLRAMADAPCPPDIIGVNHYLTSDRFLDHRIQRYPTAVHGGNAHRRYADTEAVRVLEPAPPGLSGVLREAWERYGIRLAVTEIHNGCTREEQMRWTAEAWRTAHVLRAEGIDVCAVTSWSLLGSSGWDTLLTAPGSYEPGAYDVSNGNPQPTAMVALLKSLTVGDDFPPAADGEGWWRRPVRLINRPVARPAPMREHRHMPSMVDAYPILIACTAPEDRILLVAACRHRGLVHHLLDVTNGESESFAALLDRHRPWAVIGGDDGVARDCAARALPHVAYPDPTGGAHAPDLLDRLIDRAAFCAAA